MGRERNSGPGRQQPDDPRRRAYQQRQRDTRDIREKYHYEQYDDEIEEYELDEEEEGYLPPPRPRPRPTAQESARYSQPPQRATRRISSSSGPYHAVPRRSHPPQEPQERPATPRPRPAQPQRPATPRSPQPPRARQRSRWPTLLLGCMLGIMTAVLAGVVFSLFIIRSLQGGTSGSILPGIGEKTYTRADPPITLPVTTVTQVFVCNKSGNVDLTVNPDAKATGAIINVNRKVQAQSQADAEQEYQRIKVQAQTMDQLSINSACKSPLAVASNATTGTAVTDTATPTSTTTTENIGKQSLVVNVAFLNTDELNNAPVDLAISLPQKALIGVTPADMLVGVELSQRGNITVKGINGIFRLSGSVLDGNITVTGTMAAGSEISTNEGQITFRGDLAIPAAAPPAGGYFFHLSATKIDATLPVNKNMKVDIKTLGNINNNGFPLQQGDFTKEGNTNHYNGYLNPDAKSSLPAEDYQVSPDDIFLSLHASRGDVTLRELS